MTTKALDGLYDIGDKCNCQKSKKNYVVFDLYVIPLLSRIMKVIQAVILIERVRMCRILCEHLKC